MSFLVNTTSLNDSGQFNCEICFQNYSQVGSSHSIACLPCGHIFGKNCLFQWLESKKPQIICPKCKKVFNNFSFSEGRFEDYIITIYGLPCNGNISIEYEDTNKKFDQLNKELLEIKEENVKLRRELDSLRKNFRYLSSQRSHRVPLFSSYATLNNHSSITDRIRPHRINNINNSSGVLLNTRRGNSIYDYLTRLSSVPFSSSSSNRYTDSVVPNPSSPNDIPEFTISDEGEHAEVQPDEIVILSDDDEANMDDTVFQEFVADDFNEPDNSNSNELNNSQIVTVSFTNCYYSLKCVDISDAALFGQTIVVACRISREDDPSLYYGLRFVSLRNNFSLEVSTEPINKIDIIKSRNNFNRYNILVASSNILYIVKFYADNFEAVLSKTLNHTNEITSLAWITHKQFAFGTSDGEVIFGDLDTFVNISQTRKRSSTKSNKTNKDPIVQLCAATHGHVFGVQGKKIFLYHKDSNKTLVKEYNMSIKCINLNANRDKLFCFLVDQSQTIKILSYMIVEHIRTQRTYLNVDDNLMPTEFCYKTACIKMKTSLFEYRNQIDNFIGFFDYNKDRKQLSVGFLNQSYNGKLGLQIHDEPIKVVTDASSTRINSSEILKFAVVTNEEIYVYELNCNF